MTVTPSHSNNFDFVRLVAALCVVVSHQFALTGHPEPTLFGLHSLGGMGVLVFFSVSGFLVAQSWDADPHVGRFAARRLLRIWPAFAFVILLAALVWGPLMSQLPAREYFRHPMVRQYLGNLWLSMWDMLPVRLEGNALPTAVNGPLWTIPLELKCYLVLAVMGAAGLLRRRWPAVVLLLALLLPYAVIEPRGEQLVQSFGWTIEQRYLLEFGLFFIGGALLHWLRFDDRRAVLRYLAIAWALAAIAAWAGRPLLAVWFALPVSVIALGRASTPGLRAAGRFGDLSYGLYIFAFPVQQTLVHFLGGRVHWAVLAGLVLAVSTALAWASWHGLEKRALRLKPSRPRAQAAAVDPGCAVISA